MTIKSPEYDDNTRKAVARGLSSSDKKTARRARDVADDIRKADEAEARKTPEEIVKSISADDLYTLHVCVDASWLADHKDDEADMEAAARLRRFVNALSEWLFGEGIDALRKR